MNASKGHQGFVKKYQKLGETKHVRVPISISQKIKQIILLLEKVALEKGEDKVSTILDKIIEGLEQL